MTRSSRVPEIQNSAGTRRYSHGDRRISFSILARESRSCCDDRWLPTHAAPKTVSTGDTPAYLCPQPPDSLAATVKTDYRLTLVKVLTPSITVFGCRSTTDFTY